MVITWAIFPSKTGCTPGFRRASPYRQQCCALDTTCWPSGQVTRRPVLRTRSPAWMRCSFEASTWSAPQPICSRHPIEAPGNRSPPFLCHCKPVFGSVSVAYAAIPRLHDRGLLRGGRPLAMTDRGVNGYIHFVSTRHSQAITTFHLFPHFQL